MDLGLVAELKSVFQGVHCLLGIASEGGVSKIVRMGDVWDEMSITMDGDATIPPADYEMPKEASRGGETTRAFFRSSGRRGAGRGRGRAESARGAASARDHASVRGSASQKNHTGQKDHSSQ